MQPCQASDIDSLLRRAGVPDLLYRSFHNPPTRRAPAEAEQAVEAFGDDAPLPPETDVFPVPPMAWVQSATAQPRAHTTAASGEPAQVPFGIAAAPALPSATAASFPLSGGGGAVVNGAPVRLPLVEAALSAVAAPGSAPVQRPPTLAILRGAAG
jgi:hypothetical protein